MVEETNKPESKVSAPNSSDDPAPEKEQVTGENANPVPVECAGNENKRVEAVADNQESKETLPENVKSTELPPSQKKTEVQHEDDEDGDGDIDATALLGLDDLNLSSVDVYELSNYTFGRKDRESRSFALRAKNRTEEKTHLAERYGQYGLRRSVAAVLLVHIHRFAHVLLLQRADGTGDFSLPGGRLRPGESDLDGLSRKLRAKLTPDDADKSDGLEVGELLSNWYRIDFGGRFYPYLPVHVSAPKEELHVYEVPLPESFAFSVPRNMQLVATSVYDLFNDPNTYGNVIAAVPSLISRIHKNYC